MTKTMTAIAIAALTFGAVSVGATTGSFQVTDLRVEFPTNDQENDVNIRQIAEFPTNDQENDVSIRQIAALEFANEYPEPRGDSDSPDIRWPGESAA